LKLLESTSGELFEVKARDFCFMTVSDLRNILQCKEKSTFNRQQIKTYYMPIHIMYKEPKLHKSKQYSEKAANRMMWYDNNFRD
jgi:hypothetical protein